MDTALASRRTAAPIPWLTDRLTPDGRPRRRLIEACRAELVWARADWLEIAGCGSAPDDAWLEALLPHEQAAARLLALWGELHPIEHRLREARQRLHDRRDAGWDCAGTLEDLQNHRHERRLLLPAFDAAAADYRAHRAKLGCTVSASGWPRQKARTASNLWRKAS
jgi:hypothetical protein